MKNRLFSLLAIVSMGVCNLSYAQEEATEVTDYNVDTLSEALGYFISQTLVLGKTQDTPNIQYDLDHIIKGMKNAVAGLPPPMTEEEYESAMASIEEKAFNQLAQLNLAQAVQFLNNNALAEGIVEVEAGMLQYKVVEPGTGPVVSEHATPVIHYTGSFIDGTVFRSSMEAGEPITLPLSQTIPGFSKGIVGMHEGEKRKLFIHPDLAYGTSRHLPPNSLLIFDVEVVQATTSEVVDDEGIAFEDYDDVEDEMVVE